MTSGAASCTMIVREFRAHAAPMREASHSPLILVHHVGARSWTERVTPLGCFPRRRPLRGRRLKRRITPAPGLHHNLKAHPSITVEVVPEMFTAVAQELTSPRAELWPTLARRIPHSASTRPRSPGRSLSSY